MEELTIEQKAARYDEILARAKGANIPYYKEDIMSKVKEFVDYLLPELKESKESEGERIRELLLDNFKSLHKACPNGFYRDGITYNSVIAWLEKQGEQKPADKVEPKFHEGEWVVVDDGRIGRIIECTKDFADVDLEFSCLSTNINSIRLWTIQDAKDGDVLATLDYILIFKELLKNDGGVSYCHYDFGAGNPQFIWSEDKNWYLGKEAIIHPATKGQRDLLFKKMKEAGYEWDAENKQLRKIEQKTPIEGEFPYNNPSDTLDGEIENIWGKLSSGGKFSATKEGFREVITHFANYIKQKPAELPKGEDYGIDGLYAAIDILQKTLGEVDGYQSDDGILSHKCAISAVKELSKQEWSEEDEHGFENCLHAIKETFKGADNPHRVGTIDWLKSIKGRYAWKLSEEQIKALKWVLTNVPYCTHKEEINGLLEQLKQL